MDPKITKVWHVKLERPGYEYCFIYNGSDVISSSDALYALLLLRKQLNFNRIIEDFISRVVSIPSQRESSYYYILHDEVEITTKELNLVDLR